MNPSVPAPRPLSQPGGPLSRAVAGWVVRLMGALSSPTKRRLSRFIGMLAYGLGIRRRVALDNLRHAYPEKPDAERRAIAKAAYVNMARTALEGLAGHLLTPEELERVVVFDESWAPLQQALDEVGGVLVASAHFGAWELAAEVIPQRGYKVNAVVRPLKGSLNARLMEARLRSGLKLIPARGAVSGIQEAIAAREAVVMLLDQAIPNPKGVFVPFFGRLASTSPGLAVAALRTGAPVFALVAAREADHVRMMVEGPLPPPPAGRFDERVVRYTADAVAALERMIRRAPEQWLWLHRRWKVTPPTGTDGLPPR